MVDHAIPDFIRRPSVKEISHQSAESVATTLKVETLWTIASLNDISVGR